MKSRNFMRVLIILAVVLGTSCKKKVEEPVYVAPKPVVEVEEEPLTIDQEMGEALKDFQNQGTTSYTKVIYPGDLKSGKTGQITLYKADVLLSYEETLAIAEKYLVIFSWQALKSGRSLPVGFHPLWKNITNVGELEKWHEYHVWDLKTSFGPGEIFYVVGPNKIAYIGKFEDKEGNVEYFAYYPDRRELPEWVKPI